MPHSGKSFNLNKLLRNRLQQPSINRSIFFESGGLDNLNAAGDEPDAALSGFWERIWVKAETRAKQGAAILLLDGVHLLSDWQAVLRDNGIARGGTGFQFML